MSKAPSLRSNAPPSTPSPRTSRGSKKPSEGRYLRPVPYATTLALDQFFEGGSIESHMARRTTPSAKPSPLSPPHHHYHESRKRNKSSKPTRSSTQQQQQQQQASPPSRRESKQQQPSHEHHRPTQHLTPVLTAAERDICRGASLPVVDEKGQIWYDWEEKQEYTPLISVEHERSGWVNFPGGVGRSGSSSSNSDGEESDCESPPSSPITPALPLPLHMVLDAFSFPPPPPSPSPSAVGGGARPPRAAPPAAAAATATIVVDPKDPMHGLQVPPGDRPRGKARRIVRRADSLPALPRVNSPNEAEKEAAAREFLDASFDAAQAMLAVQQHQQQQQQRQQQQAQQAAAAADATASSPDHNKLAFGKRASISMKSLKKLIFRKKPPTAV